ncbi:hypothetical protein Gohar_014720, partial [Gossypium harknessii]|nr:hypothetical protein [Gossypium harknessii]
RAAKILKQVACIGTRHRIIVTCTQVSVLSLEDRYSETLSPKLVENWSKQQLIVVALETIEALFVQSGFWIGMSNEEAISNFYAKLCDISNQAFVLSEEHSNAKLAQKILGYLYERFVKCDCYR